MAQAPGLALQPAVQVGGAAARLLDAPVGRQHALARDPAELAQAVALLPAQADPHRRRVAPRQQPFGDLAPFVVVGEGDQVAAVAGAVGGGVGEAQAVGLPPVAVAGVRRREAVAARRAGEAAARAAVAVDLVAVVALLDVGADLRRPRSWPAGSWAGSGRRRRRCRRRTPRPIRPGRCRTPPRPPASASPRPPAASRDRPARAPDPPAITAATASAGGPAPARRSVGPVRGTLSEVAAASGVRPAVRQGARLRRDRGRATFRFPYLPDSTAPRPRTLRRRYLFVIRAPRAELCAELFGMQHLCQAVDGGEQAGARAVEVEVAVGHEGPAGSHRPQVGPARAGLQAPAGPGRARGRAKPQGRSPARRDRPQRTSCQSMAREWTPGVPRASSPPASATSSGPQLPMANGGSVHSRQTTRGRGKAAVSARQRAMRARRSATSWRPASARSMTAATRSKSASTPSRFRPGTWPRAGGAAPAGAWAAAPVRASGPTAQTSQWVWVITTSGASAARAASSTW